MSIDREARSRSIEQATYGIYKSSKLTQRVFSHDFAFLYMFIMPTTTQSSSHIKPSVPRLVPHTGSHQSISVAGKRSPLPSRNNSPTNPDANTTTFPLANRKPEPGPDAPLNPDLPTKDVLFIFANFASYMRAPGQGHEGVDEAGLRHASRLLNYARVSPVGMRMGTYNTGGSYSRFPFTPLFRTYKLDLVLVFTYFISNIVMVPNQKMSKLVDILLRFPYYSILSSRSIAVSLCLVFNFWTI